MRKWYLGFLGTKSARPFVTATKPTQTRYPEFSKVLGPFKSHEKALDYAEDMGVTAPVVGPTRGRHRKNPAEATEIYGDILAIEAKKGKNSLWPKELFRHDFTSKGTRIFGLKDGSLFIKGKKRLWKKFDY